MLETGTSGLMSGEGKRVGRPYGCSVPRPSSTLPSADQEKGSVVQFALNRSPAIFTILSTSRLQSMSDTRCEAGIRKLVSIIIKSALDLRLRTWVC